MERYEGQLVDGRRILFRPITPADKDLIRGGFEALSPESRYRRFFRHIDRLSDAHLAYLTEVDGRDHFAWVALLPDDGTGAGVSRWIRLKGEAHVAEAAVTVIDPLQGLGIGTMLLWLAIRSAIEQGVEAFRVVVQGENHPVLGLLAHYGVVPDRWESGLAEIDIPLPGRTAHLELPSRPILRAVARGELEPRSIGATELGTGFVIGVGEDPEKRSAPDRT